MKIKIQGHSTTVYMVLFQSSFVILCSTNSCNWSAMGKKTISSLHTSTEQTIFDFSLTKFSPHSTTNLLCCEIFNTSLKDEAIGF